MLEGFPSSCDRSFEIKKILAHDLSPWLGIHLREDSIDAKFWLVYKNYNVEQLITMF